MNAKRVLHADSQLIRLLGMIDGSALDPGEGSRAEDEQRRADSMLARIAWSRIVEPGDGTAGSLLAALGAETALEMIVNGVDANGLSRAAQRAEIDIPAKALKEGLSRWLPRLSRSQTVSDIERARDAGIRIVLPGDRFWPTALDDLEQHAPVMLWVRGEPKRLLSPSMGIVGARAATGYGTHITAEITDGVCAAGFSIVSGAAYGIDAVAHRTALAAGAATIAVLAGGADRPYPSAHESLLARISEAGAVCSEMIPGSAPTKWRFLLRNRLIAALSRGTVVAEAGLRSGSLNTAGHAAQLGRPVGAVPGPVTSAASAGCHRLIREYAATLITNARDACEMLGIDDQSALLPVASADGSHSDSDDRLIDRDGAWERRVLDAIPLRGAKTAAEIGRRCGLPTEQVHGVIAELELLGRVRRQEHSRDGALKWSLAAP